MHSLNTKSNHFFQMVHRTTPYSETEYGPGPSFPLRKLLLSHMSTAISCARIFITPSGPLIPFFLSE
jgi:hypothetical protein